MSHFLPSEFKKMWISLTFTPPLNLITYGFICIFCIDLEDEEVFNPLNLENYAFFNLLFFFLNFHSIAHFFPLFCSNFPFAILQMDWKNLGTCVWNLLACQQTILIWFRIQIQEDTTSSSINDFFCVDLFCFLFVPILW